MCNPSMLLTGQCLLSTVQAVVFLFHFRDVDQDNLPSYCSVMECVQCSLG